jgi:hypothetical protein
MMMEVTIRTFVAEHAEMGPRECWSQLFADGENFKTRRTTELGKTMGESQIRGLRRALRTMMPLIEKHPTATSEAISVTGPPR